MAELRVFIESRLLNGSLTGISLLKLYPTLNDTLVFLNISRFEPEMWLDLDIYLLLTKFTGLTPCWIDYN